MREFTLLELVQRLDPNWRRESENPVEYEMSNGRVFRGQYRHRGPYAPDMQP